MALRKLSVIGPPGDNQSPQALWAAEAFRSFLRWYVAQHPTCKVRVYLGYQATGMGPAAFKVAEKLGVEIQVYEPSYNKAADPVSMAQKARAYDCIGVAQAGAPVRGALMRNWAYTVCGKGDDMVFFLRRGGAAEHYLRKALEYTKPTYLIDMDACTAGWLGS